MAGGLAAGEYLRRLVVAACIGGVIPRVCFYPRARKNPPFGGPFLSVVYVADSVLVLTECVRVFGEVESIRLVIPLAGTGVVGRVTAAGVVLAHIWISLVLVGVATPEVHFALGVIGAAGLNNGDEDFVHESNDGGTVRKTHEDKSVAGRAVESSAAVVDDLGNRLVNEVSTLGRHNGGGEHG